jgi:hypothetical protein
LWATQVTDVGLIHLTSLINLTKLNLDQTLVGDEGLMQVGKLSTLKNLILRSTQITDDGIEHLLTLINLETLNVEFCTSLGDTGKRLIQEKLPNVILTQ